MEIIEPKFPWCTSAPRPALLSCADADEVTINLVHAGLPEQFKLAASPELSDPSGRSSRFTLADAELAKHMDDASANPKLTLTIDGTSYRGEIEHDHGHSGHDHDH